MYPKDLKELTERARRLRATSRGPELKRTSGRYSTALGIEIGTCFVAVTDYRTNFDPEYGWANNHLYRAAVSVAVGRRR